MNNDQQPIQQPQDFQPQPIVAPINNQYQQAIVADSGKNLGIFALVAGFIAPPIGIVLGIIAQSKSKKTGHKNSLALAGIIIGTVNTILAVILTAILISTAVLIFQKCNELGDGVHVVDGVTYTCDFNSKSDNI